MMQASGVGGPIEVRGEGDGWAPLTARQALIWVEHELARGAPANVMVARFDVAASIDPTRFADAFETLVRETEALRTVIDDGPVQRVRPDLFYRPPFVDLMDAPDPDAALDAWLRQHAVRPLDLRARMFDAALIALAPDRHVVYLRQHHLVTDAEAHALLWRRLGELYDRRPGPVNRPFSEHLEREKAYRASAAHADDARFWSARLADAAPSPSFYGRSPRDRRGLIRREIVRLGEARSERLRAVAPRALLRHRLYATALFALMARVTDQRRLVIGSPLANRGTKRLKQVVGLVMEQCPTACEVPLGITFAELSGRVATELNAVLPRGRYCTHNPSRQRLYDATLNVHTAKYTPFAGASVEASIAPALSFASSWPAGARAGGEALALTAWEDGRGEVLAFDLNRDVFEDPYASRVIAHFLTMLDALLADPSRPIDDVDLLTDHERAVCLAPMPRPVDLPNVIESFLAQAARTPERAAIGCPGRQLTYRELALRAGGITRALREHGVQPGDTIAVALDRSELLPAALLGVMGAGAAYVPLDPDHPAERLARIVEDARPSALLTEPSVSLAFDLPRVDASIAGHAELEPPAVEPGDLAYVIFTSGSTGRPKGVEITHRGLASFLAAFAHTPGMSGDDRVIAMATPTFDIHVVELLLPLVVGAYAYVTPARVNADPMRLAEIIGEVQPTIVQATPPTWRLLLSTGWPGDPRLTALIGGEPLPPDLAEALLARTGNLYNVYGPTETTVWATAQRIERPEMPASVGRPVGHLSARVLDPRGRPVPMGVEGEIHLGGRGVARGYRNRPELTSQSFVEIDGERLYRTGDRGRFREDGSLECLGRRDGQVKVRGHRVELGEVEAVLRELAGVNDAAVVLAHDTLVAHVAGRTDMAALRAHAMARLPSHMVPARWQICDALPIGPTGKVDRSALGAGGETISGATVAPRDDTEAALAALFAEALDVPRVGVTDDFFDLGGHSLVAARLVEQIRATLGVELPLGALFTARTVAALAERVHRGAAPVPGCIALSRGKGLPLFCVCGVHVYHALAVRLARPVYGVYLPVEEEVVRDARAGRTTELSVDHMARAYVQLIREKQPHGPYALAGLSFGGLLAYEIAQQLRAQGESVGLLALFDSILPRALERDPRSWIAAQAKGFARAPGERMRRILGKVEPEAEDASAAIVRERAYVAAMKRYRPRSYDGEVLLFRATESSFGEGWRFPRDGGLGAFAPRLRTLDVPGSHLGVLQPPNVDVLAEALAPFLARAG